MAKPRLTKKIDPLAVSLRLLSRADRDSIRAVRSLCKAILSPVIEPALKTCAFQLGNKWYSAVLTSDQCETILKVVKQKGDAPATVSGLLGGLSLAIGDSVDELVAKLGRSPQTRRRKVGEPIRGTKVIPLGCCTYQGGRTPNLSQSQCNQYNPLSWDSGSPDCVSAPRS